MKVKAKKHLGQHFLNDEQIALSIVGGLTWDGYGHVLEIGPGMGVLTKYVLSAGKKIDVIEIDDESVDYLKAEFQLKYPGMHIYNEDFLKMNLSEKFPDQVAVLGNFPYNISSQIVFGIIEHRKVVPEMVGMFQKEVAERIASPKGNKDYGILSVLTQAYYEVEYLFTVPENVFTPPPKVKSGVIRMKRTKIKLETDEKLFFRIVKMAFNQRRKTLRNTLKGLEQFDKLNQDESLQQMLALRAEQLSVEDFILLTQKAEA